MALDVFCHGLEQSVCRRLRRKGHLGVDARQAKIGPRRRLALAEERDVVARPIGVKRCLEGCDGAGPLQDHRIVGLNEETTPAEVGRAADSPRHRGALNDDDLVVLKIPHVVAPDIGSARRRDRTGFRLVLARSGLGMVAFVIDQDFQPRSNFLKARDHIRLAEIIGNDANFRSIGDSLIEHLKDGTARLEAHPGQRLFCLWVSGDKAQPVRGQIGQQGRDRAGGLVAIDEGLRRHEAAREGDIELTGVGLPAQFDRRFLRNPVAQLVAGVHEDRRDAVDELTGQFGIAGKMHPAEFLNWRQHRR